MKGLIAKHFIKFFFILWKYVKRMNQWKKLCDVEILQKTVFIKRISIWEAEMPIYFLAMNDERQGGVESNDKVWLWNLNVAEWKNGR